MTTTATRALLGDFVEERTERLKDGTATVYSVTNEAGFVRSLDLFDKQVFSADTAAYKKVAFNDLAYNPSRINVGSVGLCQDPQGGAVSPMYVVLRCKPGLLPEFLLYFLKSDIGMGEIRHRCHGAVRDQLRYKDFCTIPILLPSVGEQERIVALLAEADRIQELCDRADVRLADFGKSLFLDMFGDPAFPDRNWESTTLSGLGRLVTGNTPSRANAEYFGRSIEWVKTDNIQPADASVSRAAEGLSDQGMKVGRVVPAGSVLVTCIAGSKERIGDAAIVDRAVAINQQINAIIPHLENNPVFVCAQVGALRQMIQHRTTGVMTKMISKSTLCAVPAIRPPRELQDEFAERLGESLSLARHQGTRRAAVERLRQSMLHEAFSEGLLGRSPSQSLHA